MNRDGPEARLDWSEWMDLHRVNDASRGTLSARGAVYQLRAVNEQDIAQPQSRFLAMDPDGLLYIGQTSGSIDRRMKALLRGWATGTASHTVGRKLHILDRLPGFMAAFDGLSIHFRYAACVDPTAVERALLRGYAARFGETPPLNGEFPDRGDRKAWAGYLV